MKQIFTFKWLIMSLMLVMGVGQAWADTDPDWSYTVSNGDNTKLNTTAKTFTVDATHVWSYEGTTVAVGSPTVTIAKYSGVFGIFFGSSGSNYFNPVILSTTAFNDVSITKVRLQVKHNGSTVAGSFSVKQGDVTIGTATIDKHDSWVEATCSETNKGLGGTLSIQYDVAQALYISRIDVWYEELSLSPLASIAVSNAPTSFYVGDTFTHDGATVTATFENNTTTDVTSGATFSEPDLTTTGTKTVTVSYTAGEVTKTTSYDITVSTRTLSSIALSGTHPTTFQQNGTFSYEGLVVTAAYDDESTKDVSDAATVSSPDLTTTGTKTVTVSYSENGVEKTATYDVTVEAVVQPTSVVFDFNYEFLGVKEKASVTANVEKTIDNVVVLIDVTSGTKTRGDATYIRLYNGNKLSFTAPTGYNITKIALTKSTVSGNSWGNPTTNIGTYTTSNKEWTGESEEVVFSFSSTSWLDKATVTLAKATPKYALNFSADPAVGGIVTVTDEDDNDVTSGSRYEEDKIFDVIATANTGYSFSGWTAEGITLSDEDKANNNIIIEMPANAVTLTAGFTLNTHELLVSGNNGTYVVTVNDETWNGTDEIPYGANVVVTATANAGWDFTSWTTDLEVADKTANPISFTMPDEDVIIEAGYADLTEEFTILYYVGGTEYSTTRQYGAELNLTSPAAINGMTFVGWSESNDITSAPTFVSNTTAVTDDMILYAIFASQVSTSYVKQTTGTAEDGVYLIVCETYNVALDGSLETIDKSSNTITVEIADGAIASNATTDAAAFTWNSSNGTLTNRDGVNIGHKGSKNTLDTGDGIDSNTISYNSGNAIITAGTTSYKLQYNSASGQTRFRYFTSSQQAVQLYKKTSVASGYSLGVPDKVSVSAAKYSTFCSAQAVDFSETGIKAYTAKVDNDVVKLTEVTDGIIPANTGVVIYSSEAVSNVEVPATVCSATLSNNEMVANVTRTKVYKKTGDNFNYILQKDGETSVVFNMALEEGAYLPAGKAYLSTAYDASASGAPLRFVIDDVPTAISNVNVENKAFDGVIYNLSGQRIATPQRGIYIVNGKKVYVK